MRLTATGREAVVGQWGSRTTPRSEVEREDHDEQHEETPHRPRSNENAHAVFESEIFALTLEIWSRLPDPNQEPPSGLEEHSHDHHRLLLAPLAAHRAAITLQLARRGCSIVPSAVLTKDRPQTLCLVRIGLAAANRGTRHPICSRNFAG